MMLALQLSHFTAATLFAFFFSIVIGITQRNTPNEMVRYGAYCFAMALGGLFVAGWTTNKTVAGSPPFSGTIMDWGGTDWDCDADAWTVHPPGNAGSMKSRLVEETEV